MGGDKTKTREMERWVKLFSLTSLTQSLLLFFCLLSSHHVTAQFEHTVDFMHIFVGLKLIFIKTPREQIASCLLRFLKGLVVVVVVMLGTVQMEIYEVCHDGKTAGTCLTNVMKKKKWVKYRARIC